VDEVERWVTELGAVLAAPDLPRLRRNEPGLDKKWRAGDIARTIPKRYVDEVAKRVGIASSLLNSYAEVARAYPPEERTVRTAWTIYRELRLLPPAERRIHLKDGVTLRQARLAIGKGPMDQPKRERQSDDERAWAIIEELQVPRIRQLVEDYMRMSSTDRKARKAAKTTLDEIAARKKFIEAELRKQAREPTPDSQYWMASKELTDASRFVYSVARLHDRHADAFTEERWTDLTQTLRNLADSAQDVADRIEGLVGSEFMDVEEVSELLELGSGSADFQDLEIIGDE